MRGRGRGSVFFSLPHAIADRLSSFFIFFFSFTLSPLFLPFSQKNSRERSHGRVVALGQRGREVLHQLGLPLRRRRRWCWRHWIDSSFLRVSPRSARRLFLGSWCFFSSSAGSRPLRSEKERLVVIRQLFSSSLFFCKVSLSLEQRMKKTFSLSLSLFVKREKSEKKGGLPTIQYHRRERARGTNAASGKMESI